MTTRAPSPPPPGASGTPPGAGCTVRPGIVSAEVGLRGRVEVVDEDGDGGHGAGDDSGTSFPFLSLFLLLSIWSQEK